MAQGWAFGGYLGGGWDRGVLCVLRWHREVAEGCDMSLGMPGFRGRGNWTLVTTAPMASVPSLLILPPSGLLSSDPRDR